LIDQHGQKLIRVKIRKLKPNPLISRISRLLALVLSMLLSLGMKFWGEHGYGVIGG
jgi:hypothetical protein